MTQLYGHHDARRQLLETPAGQPVLLTGPSGIGKAAVAHAVAHHFADLIDVAVYRPVRMADARALAAWANTTPMGTRGKAAALDPERRELLLGYYHQSLERLVPYGDGTSTQVLHDELRALAATMKGEG